MNVEQLDGFFAALISGPESEDERVQPERLRVPFPNFVLHFCGLLGSDGLSQIGRE